MMNLEVACVMTVEVGELRDELAQFARRKTGADDRAVQMRIQFCETRATAGRAQIGLGRLTACVACAERARAGKLKRRGLHDHLVLDRLA
jgi:hypothetical protein